MNEQHGQSGGVPHAKGAVDQEVIRSVIARLESTAKALERAAWFAVPDDTTGGWAVANVNKPVSEHDSARREMTFGKFLSEPCARHVAAFGPLPVLALCQSLRDILTEYQGADEAAKADPEDISARVARFAFLLALRAVARGLGIGDGASADLTVGYDQLKGSPDNVRAFPLTSDENHRRFGI